LPYLVSTMHLTINYQCICKKKSQGHIKTGVSSFQICFGLSQENYPPGNNMTEYYLFETNNYLDYGVTQNPKLGDELSFLSGRVITGKMPELVFEVNFPAEEKLPHFLGNEIPLLSKTLVDALQKAGIDSFQVFPAILLNSATGQSWNNYVAFNTIGLIKAVNMEKSDFDILMEGDDEGIEIPLVAFREIILDKNKTNDALMFRTAESPVNLVVQSRVITYLGDNRPKDGWGIAIKKLETI
jgi:hypothetical protein